MKSTAEEKSSTSQQSLSGSGERNSRGQEWLDMFSMFVHDLESPLASMKYLVGVLESGKFNPGNPLHKRLLASTQIAVVRAETILYDILAVAKSGSAQLQATIAPVDVQQIMRDVVLLSHGAAGERGISVTDNPVYPPCSVSADATLLKRVLDNLIFNAIRHTPGGGIIRVYADVLDASVRVCVKDSGPGLGDIDPEILFDKFGQVEARIAGTNRGVGLGLYFCKLAADAMGATMNAGNHPDGGAVFSITLAKQQGNI